MSQNNHQLHPCFQKGLVFGESEQIEYLKNINFQAECEDEKRANGLKPFTVCIQHTSTYETTVWAENADDAGEDAYDEMDIHDWDDVEKDVRICDVDAGES